MAGYLGLGLSLSGIGSKRSTLHETDEQVSNRNKINILFLIDMFNGPKGGIERHFCGGTEKHLYALARGLDKDKFNVMICFFEGNNILADLLESESIPAIPLRLKRLYELRALFVAFKMARIIKKHRIDIVQTYHFKSDTYGVFVSRLLGVSKIISSRRDSGDLKSPRQLVLNKIMDRFIDRFIVVCDKVGRSLAESEGTNFNKMTTIYNGVDLNKFHADSNWTVNALKKGSRIKNDDFILGTVALFRPEKGYDVFLDGIRRVAFQIKNMKVVLIGDGPTYGQCKKYCEQYELEDTVVFTGYVENVEKYLNVMDVFCLIPKSNEGFSNAILEAMAMGKPIIATNVGGNSEAILHGETGLIIPPGDPQRFAEAIMTLYQNATKRLEMGEKARKRAEALFSLEKMIEEHEKLYEEVMFTSRVDLSSNDRKPSAGGRDTRRANGSGQDK